MDLCPGLCPQALAATRVPRRFWKVGAAPGARNKGGKWGLHSAHPDTTTRSKGLASPLTARVPHCPGPSLPCRQGWQELTGQNLVLRGCGGGSSEWHRLHVGSQRP